MYTFFILWKFWLNFLTVEIKFLAKSNSILFECDTYKISPFDWQKTQFLRKHSIKKLKEQRVKSLQLLASPAAIESVFSIFKLASTLNRLGDKKKYLKYCLINKVLLLVMSLSYKVCDMINILTIYGVILALTVFVNVNPSYSKEIKIKTVPLYITSIIQLSNYTTKRN